MAQHTFQPEEEDKEHNELALTAGVQNPASYIQNPGEETVDSLLSRFQAATALSHREVRKAVWFGCFGLIATTFAEILCLLSVSLVGSEALPMAAVVGIWLLYLTVLGIVARPAVKANRTRKALREQLARHDDVRVLGPLAEMLASPAPALRRAAGPALCRLLPRLSSTAAPHLTLEQRENLYAVLRGYPAREEIELQIALLRALPYFGDAAILGTVERMAEPGSASRRRRILREEARECLPALRERARKQLTSNILLRPSSAEAPADHLLHPTQEPTPDGSQLLRPEQELPPRHTGGGPSSKETPHS